MAAEEFRRGDAVEVRGPEEILATLDESGALEGLPFMPEMVALCGRSFTVDRRAERVCDTIRYTGTRRLHDAVLLDDLRCDGAAHGGCQAECRFFWKEAWLRRPEGTPRSPPPVAAMAALRDRAVRGGRTRVEVGGSAEERHRCQATELLRCTEHVPLWNAVSYAREVSCGNVGLGHFLKVMSRVVVEEPMRKLGLMDEIHLRGTAQKGVDPPRTDLQPGEYVRVRSREEIARTLNPEGRNKGLWFDREMLFYCGQVFRVRQRVRRFLDERDGKMVELKTDAITLEGVVCTGERSLRRWFCPRAILPYWRESWLERVEQPTAVPAARSG